MGNYVSKNFNNFSLKEKEEDSINEHLLKIPRWKVKKIIIYPFKYGYHNGMDDKIVCYAGRDYNGLYLKFDDLNWIIVKNIGIKSICEFDEEDRTITAVVDNDKLKYHNINKDVIIVMSFIISPFSMTKDLEKSLENSYAFYVKNFTKIPGRPNSRSSPNKKELTKFQKWVMEENRRKKPGDVEVLNMAWKKFGDIRGIEVLKNLQKLDCAGNLLTDLTYIKELTNLKVLICSYNQMTDLDGIENLKNMEKLYCSSNKLKNLGKIEDLKNLKEISCRGNLFSSDYEKYIKDYCKSKGIQLLTI